MMKGYYFIIQLKLHMEFGFLRSCQQTILKNVIHYLATADIMLKYDTVISMISITHSIQQNNA